MRRARFAATKLQLGVGILIAAAGICVFAAGAKPGDVPAPYLRNANLSDVDLRVPHSWKWTSSGANLDHANLRGANLSSATIDDVIWNSTTCPDGTNSDDTKRTSGKGSCL